MLHRPHALDFQFLFFHSSPKVEFLQNHYHKKYDFSRLVVFSEFRMKVSRKGF
jgi:hypothetical protein